MKNNKSDIKACDLIMARMLKHGEGPVATIIVIGPSRVEAEAHAKKEMEPHFLDTSSCRLTSTSLGVISWSSIPTTIFLYVEGSGRIK